MEVIFREENIKEVAEKLLAMIMGKKVLAFEGSMGAGKTTFIHALCELLGVKDVISSPTYSVINQYMTAKGETIYHIDLYRLKDEEEAYNAGVEDCLYSGSLCLVEWPQRAVGMFPADTLYITLKVMEDASRELTILS